MTTNWLSHNTVRFTDGHVTTWATPRWPWIRLSRTGVIHMSHRAILRWNSIPRLSFITLCGYQSSVFFKAEDPTDKSGCMRCWVAWERGIKKAKRRGWT